MCILHSNGQSEFIIVDLLKQKRGLLILYEQLSCWSECRAQTHRHTCSSHSVPLSHVWPSLLTLKVVLSWFVKFFFSCGIVSWAHTGQSLCWHCTRVNYKLHATINLLQYKHVTYGNKLDFSFHLFCLRPGDFPAGSVPERKCVAEWDGAGRGVQDPHRGGFRHSAVPHAAPQCHTLIHTGEKTLLLLSHVEEEKAIKKHQLTDIYKHFCAFNKTK